MKTEYAILRDGTKIPVSDLFLTSQYIANKLRRKSSTMRWNEEGLSPDTSVCSDITNIVDVLDAIKQQPVNPLDEYRTPQAMGLTHFEYCHGKQIEVTDNTQPLVWTITDSPEFDWPNKTYRPVEKWRPKQNEKVWAKLAGDDKDWYYESFYGMYNPSHDYHVVYKDIDHTEQLIASEVKRYVGDIK